VEVEVTVAVAKTTTIGNNRIKIDINNLPPFPKTATRQTQFQLRRSLPLPLLPPRPPPRPPLAGSRRTSSGRSSRSSAPRPRRRCPSSRRCPSGRATPAVSGRGSHPPPPRERGGGRRALLLLLLLQMQQQQQEPSKWQGTEEETGQQTTTTRLLRLLLPLCFSATTCVPEGTSPPGGLSHYHCQSQGVISSLDSWITPLRGGLRRKRP